MSESGSAESAETIELEKAPLVNAAEDDSTPVVLTRNVKIAVCLSHALSTWSERTWAFAVGLIFLAIYENSLFYVSLFGLVQALASVLLSPSVGVFIDQTSRLTTVCFFYLIQNAGLVLAALASLVLLSRQAHPSDVVGTLSALAVIAFGILSRVGTMGGTIAIEKDWAKALAGNDSQELAKLNSTLKMIDLICLIVAPVVSGFLMSYCSMTVATVQILLYNLIAWFPEVALLKYATSHAPQLLSKNATPKNETPDRDPLAKKLRDYMQSLLEGFRLYFRQSCALASLSLATLHLTVLSFGIMMTAYLKWLGLSEAGLSLYRGFAALTGVLGARAFPVFHSRWSLRTTGLISISFFLACVAVGALPDIVHLGIHVSEHLRFNILVWAIAISRFGLWVFDLSVSQIIQEWVDESQLGRVSSTQKLLENVFAVLIFVGGIVAPRPQDFIWLMIVSVAAVFTSFILFLLFLTKTRYVAVATLGEIEMKQDNCDTQSQNS